MGKLDRENLHGYQEYCISFIKENPIAAILVDCGLGKTIIALTAINDLMLDTFEISRVLVVAPKRVTYGWVKEIKNWSHLKYLTYSLADGGPKEREAALKRNAMVTIIGRDNVKWLADYYQTNRIPFPFDMIVPDELSSFKNYKSQRFKAMRLLRSKVGRIIGLTATPAANSLMDLWGEISLLDRGERLGKFIGRFREKYFKAASYNPQTGIVYRYEPRQGAEEQIYAAIGDISISMKAVDYLDMPERVDVTVEVELSEPERKAYDMLKKDLIIPLSGGDVDAANAAALSNKLLQMAGGAVYDENGTVREFHQRKLDALEDVIEAANGQTVLVGYWFKHERERILKRFPKLGIREISTQQDIEDWNAGKIPVALAQPASVGLGVNLQFGGHIFCWFSPIWNLELVQQMDDRLWRQGQKDTVTIYHIIAKDTLDEDVMAALSRKDVTQEGLIAAVRARLDG